MLNDGTLTKYGCGWYIELLEIDTYRELLGNEAEIIGSNDHLLQDWNRSILS